ncbi:Canalicular multispecific organic anion transporter 1, partial [Homalodisca vitripennis]
MEKGRNCHKAELIQKYAILDEREVCLNIPSNHFADKELSWETENPRLPLCFEKTALVWGPCLLLWLLTPLELFVIFRSKCRDVPWKFTNITKA